MRYHAVRNLIHIALVVTGIAGVVVSTQPWPRLAPDAESQTIRAADPNFCFISDSCPQECSLVCTSDGEGGCDTPKYRPYNMIPFPIGSTSMTETCIDDPACVYPIISFGSNCF